jgi:dihydrofolate reductase|tara:strand:- start:485 stop:979 length:495 start_codon:yes stop_codon:yes gene_type:complete
MAIIKAILACDEQWGIGKDGDLPWPRNPADLKWFKESTLNDTVVMGKATWDSLPIKPLPQRRNMVVTSGAWESLDGDVACLNFEDTLGALTELKKFSGANDVWIIGGGQLVTGLINLIDEFHLSRISGSYNCDTFLPRSLIEELYTLTDSGRRNDVYVDIWTKR